jgi:hypothetical protein
MLNLRLTAGLAPYLMSGGDTGQNRSRSVTIDACDWPGVVAEVRNRFPNLASRIFAENGTMRAGFLIAVNSELMEGRGAPAVQPGDELFVFAQISGG